MSLFEIINGSLLGDACVQFDNYKYRKYFSYKITAIDKNFLEWLKVIFQQYSIKCWISKENKISNTFALYFYINSCPYPELLQFRNKWYKQINGRTTKIIPKNLGISPMVLLYWYLGDGSLIRRKNDENRVPYIVLATNCFSKEDIDFLVKKLKELNLNFYPVKYKSGFTGKESGYCLYSKTKDGTPYRFFKLIGLKCPKEIANCSTGRKGIYHEEKFFRDKWPNEEDWIKILSNVKGIGPILREKRLQLNLSQNQFGRKVGMRRENIRDVELSKRHFRVGNFRKILDSLDLETEFLLNKLN
jgi:hypothetical protein